jgi:2-oxoglutarate ferredoxin oxidoreductase subunit delta
VKILKNFVTIDRDVCKGCELCVVTCPKNVLAIDKEHFNAKGYHPASVRFLDGCIGCAMCAMMCPDSAIKVEKGD